MHICGKVDKTIHPGSANSASLKSGLAVLSKPADPCLYVALQDYQYHLGVFDVYDIVALLGQAFGTVILVIVEAPVQ